MSGITLAQAQARLADWLEADAKVASKQDYMIGGRRLTRANAGEIRQNIEFWDAKVRALESAAATNSGRRGPRVRYGVPL